jgi:anti-sigma B factor antagonist
MKDARSSLVQPFRIGLVLDDREIVLVLAGELDLASADVLERQVKTLRSAFDPIVLDLRRVDFIDSTGLRVLLSLRNDAKREGQGLILVPGPGQVQRIFDLTATRGLFDWRDPTGG